MDAKRDCGQRCTTPTTPTAQSPSPKKETAESSPLPSHQKWHIWKGRNKEWWLQRPKDHPMFWIAEQVGTYQQCVDQFKKVTQ